MRKNPIAPVGHDVFAGWRAFGRQRRNASLNGAPAAMTIRRMLSDAEIAAVRAPIETARTLPRRAFTDPQFYRFEEEHLLRRSWLATAFSELLPAPGALLPMTVLGVPLLLVRNDDGVLRAFHNVCPYDACEAVIDPALGQTEIVTPYHGWRYDLDGKLIAAGYWDGTQAAASLDPATLNADLVSIECAEWFGTVFVRITPDTITFDEYIAPVADYVQELDLDDLRIGHDEDGIPRIDVLSIRSNWKTVYENYAPNVYHESFVHAMYKRSPHSPRVDAQGNKTYSEIIEANGFIGLHYDNRVAGSFYPDSPFEPIRTRSGKPSARNTIANVYPNWAITILNNYARMTLFLPAAVDQCVQSIATYFDATQASDPALLAQRTVAARGGVLAREEDNRIVEAIQRARQSPAFDTHFYCPFWDRPHYALSNLLVDKLEAALRGD